MIRVLFLSHDSALYGAQLSLLGLLSRLDRKIFEPLVVAPYAGPLNDAIVELGIPVIIRDKVNWIATDDEAKKTRLRISRDFLTGLKSRVWALAYQIEHNNIDVVYTNTIAPIEGALAARITHRPHIWHLREQVSGNNQLKSPIPHRLIPYIVGRLADRVLVNSRYLGQVYARGQTKNKLEVVYNGVDPNTFGENRTEAAATLKTELGLSATSQLVVLIGSIIPRKRQLLLAQAAAIVTRHIPDATFLIIGDGDSGYIDEIKSFSEARGISKKFRILGWRGDIPHILAAANILTITADEEPFGRTAIEAMAAGTPVVSTRCGGPEEIIEDKATGLLVPRGDADALAQAIEYTLCNPTVASKMSTAGRQRLHEKFTLEAHALQVQNIITAVVRN